MLPKLCPFLRWYTVCLGEPPAQTQDCLAGILLKFHRIVKSAPGIERVLACLRQSCVFGEPDEGAPGLVVSLDFFGARPRFAFELLGGHEEVKKRDQRFIDGGQKRLFFKPFEPVVPGVFTDNRAVLLLYETVVVFLVVAAAGEGDALLFAPRFGGAVDKCGAVVAVKFQNREGDGGFDVRQGLKSPLMSLAGEGIQANPARCDIGGGQGEDVLAVRGLPAVIAD